MEDNKPSDSNSILEQLRNGFARFELVSSPTPSVSGSIPSSPLSASFFGATTGNSYAFFARIGTPLNRSPAAKKAEHYSVDRVTGDGRCLFRALVKGMAFNKGLRLNPRQERDDADELRMAVKEVMCDDAKEREKYEEAVVAITVDESLKRYCQRIRRQDFWGGESELLVLSKLCKQPIIVYIPEHEHGKGGFGSGFIPIAEYGAEFRRGWGKGKAKNAVRLLYSGRNHYDLLR
ncbi:PREDICTED: OTU domain-containing protein At3g57810 isoform X3 [Tarenaya hassleriana]|uniref:OTU domain-containing protein At3g57810 isoform X3 n=1 Tax=Tarenaya hassleriana TaxID=28532 RepID=UPI00053CA240|nr:PREDICTED: OTU domain-containing protein At3g57810 isoform X3 [Tarenaya hassleriana]